MSLSVRKFVIKQKFDCCKEEDSEALRVGLIQTFCGIPWKLTVQKTESCVGVFLRCETSGLSEERSVLVDFHMKLKSPTGKDDFTSRKYSYSFINSSGIGCPKFMEIKKLNEEYSIENKFTLECHVEIKEVRGFRQKLKLFDESVKEFSDVILKVDDQKFHVSKLFLAGQSAYFESLLLGKFAEFANEEVELKDVPVDVFQDFLELLHGESAIIKENVEALLNLAEYLNAPTVSRRCTEYLMSSNCVIPLREKTNLAVRYKLTDLKKKCFDELSSVPLLRTILPDDMEQLDHGLAIDVIQKFLKLYDDEKKYTSDASFRKKPSRNGYY